MYTSHEEGTDIPPTPSTKAAQATSQEEDTVAEQGVSIQENLALITKTVVAKLDSRLG